MSTNQTYIHVRRAGTPDRLNLESCLSFL
jgi:hypothetical protein